MNAIVGHAEARAHLAIITIVDRALDEEWNWRITQNALWHHLEQFSPRCNCGHVLRFSPWLDGLRVVKCERCGWKCLESPLNG